MNATMRSHRTAGRLLLALAIGGASIFAACAGSPSDQGPKRPFIKLASRGLGLWVNTARELDPRFAEELELYLSSELERLYHTKPSLVRGAGKAKPLDTRILSMFAEARADDLVLVQPRAGEGTLAVEVSVLTLTDERVLFEFEIEPRSREEPTGERIARRIADKLGSQFIDPGAGVPFDGLVIADRLAERGACAEAVRLYDQNLPKQSATRESVAHATREFGHRRSLELCRAKLELAARRAADQLARFSLTYDLERVDPSFHTTIKEVGARAKLEAELQRLTDKPVIVELGKNSLVVHLRYHRERYRQAVGRWPSVHREQPAIFFDAWRPAMAAATRFAEGLAERIPGTSVETYLRLGTLEGDWLEIGFARVGSAGELRISDRLRVHQVGVVEDTMVGSSSPRDLRSLIFVLGPPRTLDGKPTIYGPAVDFLDL